MGGCSVVSDDWEVTPTGNETCTVVLVGKTGNGKSATGNSLLGRKAFKSKPSSSGVTSICELQSTILRNGSRLNVIDTPGLFDFSEGGSEFIGKEIVRCMDMARDGIHGVLLVFSSRTRFSPEEEAAFHSLQALFGRTIVNYMIIVFTGGDEMEEAELTLDEYLGHRDCPEPLREIIRLCENRVVLFDNKTANASKKEEQVQQLYFLLEAVIARNGGKPFTDKLFAELKDEAIKLRELTEKVDGMTVQSKTEINDLLEKMQKKYDEQLKQITEMVESKLIETNKMLEAKLLEEQAARKKAEEMALEVEKRSRAEIAKLHGCLEGALREAHDRIAESRKCVIL